MHMTERDALTQLKQETLDCPHFQPVVAARVQVLLEVLVEEFEDECEFLLGVYDVVKADDVGVLQLFEQ